MARLELSANRNSAVNNSEQQQKEFAFATMEQQSYYKLQEIHIIYQVSQKYRYVW